MSWVMYALLGMGFMGVGNFMMKYATALGQPAFSAVVIQFCVMFVLAVGLYLFKRPELFSSTPGSVIAVIGGLCIGLGGLFLVLAFAQPHSHGGVATAILNANFALVLALGYFVLHETITLKQAIGFLALLVGMVLLI